MFRCIKCVRAHWDAGQHSTRTELWRPAPRSHWNAVSCTRAMQFSRCNNRFETVLHQRVLYDTSILIIYMREAYKDQIWDDIARTLQLYNIQMETSHVFTPPHWLPFTNVIQQYCFSNSLSESDSELMFSKTLYESHDHSTTKNDWLLLNVCIIPMLTCVDLCCPTLSGVCPALHCPVPQCTLALNKVHNLHNTYFSV